MTMKGARRAAAAQGAPGGGERGFALIGVLLMLFLLSGLVASLIISAQTESKIALNYEAEAKARAAAEAGLNHATSLVIDKLTTWQTDGYGTPGAAITALLKGPDGLTGTTATDADNGSLENLGADSTKRIPRPGTVRQLTPDESYEARVFDDDDPARGTTLTSADITRIGENSQIYVDNNKKIVVRAIGYGPNNAQVTLEAIVGFGIGDAAILVNGDIDIWGNVQVNGPAGSIHANGDMHIWGSPHVSGDATASGTYDAGGHPNIAGASGGGYPAMGVPDIHASDHLAEADWILTSSGTMTNQAGTLICNSAGGGCSGRGWTYSGGTWSVTSNTIQAGTYYAQGDIRVTGSPGPSTVSLISTGSIDISGSPNFQADDPGLLLLADGDLQINGNLTQYGAQAQILVREQVAIGGNPTLFGQIVVQNVTSVATLVHESSISSFWGSFSLTYTGGLNGGTGAPTLSGWRQQ